jgi:hypothetical protein
VTAALFLTGCATTGQKVNPQVTNALAAHGVKGVVAAKVANAEPLDYGDIETLVRAGVPSGIVESYLQSTQRTYNFSNDQLKTLQAAGAGSQLLNYLEDGGNFYGNSPKRGAGSGPAEQNARRVNSPLYQDEQPFAYNAPAVDYWYNSAYEESLYSPFSFNGD